MTQLQQLSLRYDEIFDDPESLTPLHNLTQLRKLNLSCTDVSDAGLDKLHALTTLEEISLEDCQNITEEGVTRLLEELPSIKRIDLDGCAGFSEEFVTSLEIL